LKNGVWGSQTLLVQRGSIDWFGDVATYRHPDPVAFAGYATDSGKTKILAGTLRNGRWLQTQKVTVSLVAAMRAASLADGIVVLAFGSEAGRGLSATRFRVEGDTLHAEKAVPLDSASRTYGIEAAVATLGSDSVIAVWAYRLGSQVGVPVLRTAISPDRGKSWTLQSSVEMSARPDDLRLVMDGRRVVHLIFRLQDREILGGGGSVRHFTRVSGKWLDLGRAVANPVSSRLAVGATDTGLVLLWTESSMQSGYEAPRTMASWWEPTC
jgi:hypothetical protein